MTRKRINIICNSAISIMLLIVFGLTYNFEIKSVYSNADYEPYYSGNSSNANACLMINVYWGNDYIIPILEILEANNIKTTFFIGGSWANKYPELLQNIYDAGHELGNHGYSHKDHDKLSKESNQDEIFVTHQTIKSLLGVEMNLFAPPSGAYNSVTLSVANSLGYRTIMWTKDSIDWRDQNADLIYTRATKNIKNGDLILLHPTLKTAEALQSIIDAYTNAGIKLTTVSETIA